MKATSRGWSFALTGTRPADAVESLEVLGRVLHRDRHPLARRETQALAQTACEARYAQGELPIGGPGRAAAENGRGVGQLPGGALEVCDGVHRG